MWVAFVSTDLLAVIAMLLLLVGVPVFVIGVIAVTTAYFEYDAERYLEELSTEEGDEPTTGDDR